MAGSNRKRMERVGDIIIDNISLISHNGYEQSLRGIFQNLTINEDIHTNCMHGTVTIVDSLNLAKNMPIIGMETLVITYYTPNYMEGGQDHLPITLRFRTYSVAQYVEMSQGSTTMIKLNFISEQSTRSMQKKVSRSFVEMPVSTMVAAIYDEFLASDEGVNPTSPSAGGVAAYATTDGKVPLATLTPTFDKRTYIIPTWSPLYAINWLAHRARDREDTKICDFVFFQNTDGYHFVPLTTLKKIGKRPGKYFKYGNLPSGFRGNDGQKMLASEMRNPITVNVIDFCDKAKHQSLGSFSSAIMTHDMTTKLFKLGSYSYDNEFSVERTIERYPLIPKMKGDLSTSFASHLKFVPNSSFTANNMETIHDPIETVLQRQATISQMGAINLQLEVWGDTNLKVGNVIKYQPPSKGSTKDLDDPDDDYLKGFYLVTSIKHQIEPDRHVMYVTISKDSFAEPIADVKKNTLSVSTT